MEQLKYPIGIQNFEKIRKENFVYVIKTNDFSMATTLTEHEQPRQMEGLGTLGQNYESDVYVYQ